MMLSAVPTIVLAGVTVMVVFGILNLLIVLVVADVVILIFVVVFIVGVAVGVTEYVILDVVVGGVL